MRSIPPAGSSLLFGLQTKAGDVRAVPADATATFTADLRLTHRGAGVDYAADHVCGRPGNRFLYLAWGLADASGQFVRLARAKLDLSVIPVELVEQAVRDEAILCGRLEATDDRGQPTSGGIRPPAIEWSVR